MPSLHLRQWATPLVMSAFGLMAVTGTLMFFHAAPGLSRGLHEWAGWVFLAGAGAHLAQNWRPFVLYLKRPAARGILAAGAAAVCLSFLPSSGEGAPDMRAIVNGLTDAHLNDIAALGDRSPEELLATLKSQGISATSADQTVAQVAGGDEGTEMAILQAAMTRPAP